MKKQILLVGGLTKTKSLAVSLIQKGDRVTVINDSVSGCEQLAEIPGIQVIYGDGTKPFVLEDARAQNMDIAIALTPSDPDNLVICELCKKKFQVPKTVSVLNDPRKTDFFYKMGVDSVVCTANVIAGILEHQALFDEMTALIPVGEGQTVIAQVPVLATSPVIGKKLWEINLPSEVIIGCILRNGQNLIPDGNSQILAEDTLILISSSKQQLVAVKKLTGGN